MRYLTAILLFFSLTAPAQFGTWCKGNITGWSLMTFAGSNNAMCEVLKHDYPDFKTAFPNANDDFWDPAISWQNKYKNGDPAQGEAFFGSTTVFVFATDGYHLTRMLNNTAILGTITFKFCDKKRKWYWYVADFISYGIAYSLGFNLTYELIRN